MVMLRVAAVLISLHVLAYPAIAFDYTPTPLQKSIQDHDLIVVGTVAKSEQGLCEVEVSTVIKGNRPKKNIVLPAIWRPNEKWTFGSIELTKGSKYLLLLESKKGKYHLSSDYASYGVNKIDSDEAPIVGVVAILYRLLEARDPKKQEQILTEVWETESESTKRRLLEAFYQWRNEATVPFLLKALCSGDSRDMAHAVIGHHGYTEATSILIRHLREKKCSWAAQTLGKLKAGEALDALVEAANDDEFGHTRYRVVRALGQLEDRRAIPILIDAVNRHVSAMAANNGVYYREAAYAATALGKMKAEEAIEPLIELLKLGPHFHEVGIAVFAALNEFGPAARDALPVLEKIAQDHKHTFAKDASNLIRKIRQGEKTKEK